MGLNTGAYPEFSRDWNRHAPCTVPPSGPLSGGPFTPAREEHPIRTLSVSLLAVAAIAASVLLTRRQEKPATHLVPAGEQLPAEQSLDAIRAAGL
jgi:hypothetical protein